MHTGPKLQCSIALTSITEAAFRPIGNRKTTAGRKKKLPLSSAVFALKSKHWKQLIDEKAKKLLQGSKSRVQKEKISREKEADELCNQLHQ